MSGEKQQVETTESGFVSQGQVPGLDFYLDSIKRERFSESDDLEVRRLAKMYHDFLSRDDTMPTQQIKAHANNSWIKFENDYRNGAYDEVIAKKYAVVEAPDDDAVVVSPEANLDDPVTDEAMRTFTEAETAQ